MVIWKFEAQTTDILRIKMPEGAKVIRVGTQKSFHICLWVLVDPEAPKVSRMFYVVGTGHPIPKLYLTLYLGTVFDGPYVWHVFGGN